MQGHTSIHISKKCCDHHIITLRWILDIVYKHNFINSPVIKQMIHFIFFYNPLFIYKTQFLSSKTAWFASRCHCRSSKILMMTSYWQVHCDHIFAKKLTEANFSNDKYTFDCKYVSFCIELNTFTRLGIANSFPNLPMLLFLLDVTVNISWSD